MSLARYGEYKDSGTGWLGNVPVHWGVARLKSKVELITERALHRTRPIALENVEGWSGRFIPTEGEFEGDGVAFVANDILFGKLRPYLAKAYLASDSGEAVGDFHVLRPNRTMSPRFLQYQILNRAFIDVIDGSTFGSKMPRASWESLGQMPLTLPSIEEQTAIAAFLDRETAKIDSLIAEQEKLIALLAEKRQASISHAVTKGLDPNAPMKDSGVAWLGEVPAHWQVKRFRDASASISTGPFGTALGSDDYISGGVPVINPSHIVDSSIVPDAAVSVANEAADRLSFWTLRAGDIVVARRGQLGRAAIVEAESDGWICGTGSLRVTPNKFLATPGFLHAVLQSTYAREWLNQESVGSTMANLNEGILGSLPIALPCCTEEQTQLIRTLSERLSQVGATAALAEKSVALLQERRSALIAAAVTGQIDVRNA